MFETVKILIVSLSQIERYRNCNENSYRQKPIKNLNLNIFIIFSRAKRLLDIEKTR